MLTPLPPRITKNSEFPEIPGRHGWGRVGTSPPLSTRGNATANVAKKTISIPRRSVKIHRPCVDIDSFWSRLRWSEWRELVRRNGDFTAITVGVNAVFVVLVTVVIVTVITTRVHLWRNKARMDSRFTGYGDGGWCNGRSQRCGRHCTSWCNSPYYDANDHCYDCNCCNRATDRRQDNGKIICWTRKQYKQTAQ